ncbi:zinc metallopeptidase [Eubacteriales bacterium OttesenSCG-928-G02]|nr:zinc metallopeptidase [Eubacteriales bacterium OttesenSCG-928-G02]
MYFDWTYIVIVLPMVIFSLIASARVNSTFNKYEKVLSKKGLTGREAARMVLDNNGLSYINIEKVNGKLTDHYDPKANVIRLSESVYSSTSTAAIGVAAHEAGHAVQHSQGYTPMKIRSAIIPVTNIGSQLGMVLIMIGIIMMYYSEFFINVAYAGVILYSAVAVFQLVTLPVEFNASSRALASLSQYGILDEEELKSSKKVLSAAAMTYVAALAVSIATILRFLLIIGGRSNRRE